MASNERAQQGKSSTYNGKRNAGRRINRHSNAMAQRKIFTPRRHKSESESDGICDLCVQRIKIYAIGHCDHPVCYRCSAKMRILCKQLDCAVCRISMKKVIYSKSFMMFNEANSLSLVHDVKSNAWFTNDLVKTEYEKLFEHRCSSCPNGHVESSFEKLEAHMRKEHKLFYCNLCVRFNTNFTDECKTYTRELLARHRRVGDDDDTSHKGHPLCEFCDERYLDKDVLLQHLRKDHYFCHFCDKEGMNQYYDGYVDLRQHYRRDHFLCEEGDCINEQFTSVFFSKLDLQAHRTAVHMDKLDRQQRKLEKNIDVGFQYPKPSRGRLHDMGKGRRTGQPERDLNLDKAQTTNPAGQETLKINSFKDKEHRPRVQREQPKQQLQREPDPPPHPIADFPTLGTSSEHGDSHNVQKIDLAGEDHMAPAEINKAGPTTADILAAAAGRSVGKISQEDFPSLGSKEGENRAQAGLWANSRSNTGKSNSTALMNVQKSTNSFGTFKALDDFPSLSGGSITHNVAKPLPRSKKPHSVTMASSKLTKSRVDLKDKDEFPTLNGASARNGQGYSWGPLSAGSISKKSKKAKTAKSSHKENQSERQSSTSVVKSASSSQKSSTQHRFCDPSTSNDTVTVKVGSHQHTVRLSSTDYAAAVEDAEKPVKVPGLGSSSVGTVSTEAFMMLSKTFDTSQKHSQARQSKFVVHDNEFPELSGGKRGKTNGIHSSLDASFQSLSKTSHETRDIMPKAKTDSFSKLGQLGNDDVALSSVLAIPPSLGSYASDWNGEQQPSPMAALQTKESSFHANDGDFPSLSTDMNINQSTGKRRKKQKKKGATIRDVSKHFGIDSVAPTTGQLKNLLGSEDEYSIFSVANLMGKTEISGINKREQPTSLNKDNELNGLETTKKPTFVTESRNIRKRVILSPQPEKANIEERNIWLINSIQELCGAEEEFTKFKISSGKFRQGLMSAEGYYENCRILIGNEHFEQVFTELVDLLPDLEKRAELMSIHFRE